MGNLPKSFPIVPPTEIPVNTLKMQSATPFTSCWVRSLAH